MKLSRVTLSLFLSALFSYPLSYFCLLFAREGEMNLVHELLFLYQHPTSAGPILRILYPLVWSAAFVHFTFRFSVNRDIKSEWLNQMKEKPYSYREERRTFYTEREWLTLFFPALFFALLVPVGGMHLDFFAAALLRLLLFFFANRLSLAVCRYVWCRDRIGGFSGKYN